MVAGLGPWVREQDEHPFDRGVGQGGQELASVAGVDAHVGQSPIVYVAQGAGGAVEEGLGAQEQDVRMFLGLGGEVLARAETQLDPDGCRARHDRAWIDRAACQVEAHLGQEVVQQAGAARPQAAAADTAIGAQAVGWSGGHAPL